MKERYTAIGIMSGTSMDGLDIALCEFTYLDTTWEFTFVDTITYSYPSALLTKIKNAPCLPGYELLLLHKEYGKYIGERVLQFLKKRKNPIDFIASHGHTLFHTPASGLTFQLGDGAVIAAITGIPVVSDFRSLDVALGGQGAPLVPVGDSLLFAKYTACLNLGGFANISYDLDGARKAFDICPVNIILNHLVAVFFNNDFDHHGDIGRQGIINLDLLTQLDHLDYYTSPLPKSLSREWLEHAFIPIIKTCSDEPANILRTVYEHIAFQISYELGRIEDGVVLITGGGAKNTFLIELLKIAIKQQICIPDVILIDYKEALVFAFLGLLRFRNEPNCLSSVTGAKTNSSGGCIYLSP